MAEQILTMRPGFDGLTNRACVQYDDKNACLKYETKEYKLQDAETRARLVDFGFSCLIAKKVYRVCGERAGYCRTSCTYKRDCFLGICGKKKRDKCEVEFIDANRVDYLRESGLVCASENVYPDEVTP